MIRFKHLLLAISILLSSSIFAQTQSTRTATSDTLVGNDKYRVLTNYFKDNWFLSFGGGVQIFVGDHTKQMRVVDMLSPSIDFAAGKWFSPGLGVRVKANGFNLHGISGWSDNTPDSPANQNNYQGFITNAVYDDAAGHWKGDVYEHGPEGHYPLYRTNIKYINTQVDALFNVTDIILGHNPKRGYNLIPYIGVGWAHTFNKGIYRNKFNENVMGKRSNEVSLNIGLINEFRVYKELYLTLDLGATYLNDRFDQQLGGRYGEGIGSATLGFTYKFGKRDWDREKSIITAITEKDLVYIKSNPDIIQALEKQTEPLFLMFRNVTFDFDKATIKESSHKTLDDIAAILNTMPERRFLISGYTDARGSELYNEKLSSERADAVVRELEKRGVPSNMLKSRGIGKKAATIPSNEPDYIREGDRKVTIELIINEAYWSRLPKRSMD